MARDPETRTGDGPTLPGDPGLPPADDPGGAHAKGYSADPDQTVPDVAEPIPLADAPAGGIRVPERENGFEATGRRESPDDPDNRVVSRQ